MRLKIYNESGKVRVTKLDLDGSETTLFSGLSDRGSAVIDVSSSVSFDFDNPISPIEAAYAAVPKTPEELEALCRFPKKPKE